MMPKFNGSWDKGADVWKTVDIGMRGRIDRQRRYLTVCHMYRVCARDVGKTGTVFVRIRTLSLHDIHGMILR